MTKKQFQEGNISLGLRSTVLSLVVGKMGSWNVGSCHIASEVGKEGWRSPGSSLWDGTTHIQGVPFHLETSSRMCSEVGPLGGFRSCQVDGSSLSLLEGEFEPSWRSSALGVYGLWLVSDCPHQELLP